MVRRPSGRLPSSRKNIGEWLLGACAASVPCGVLPMKKNSAGTISPKKAKSSAPVTYGISTTLPAPATRSRDGSVRRVSRASFTTTGLLSSAISTTAVAPAECAMSSAVRVRRSMICWRTAGSKLRMVPIISTSSGMMLLRMPPLIAPTDSTAGTG